MQVGDEASGFFGDDPLGPRPFLFPLAPVLLAGLRKVVDGAEVDPRKVANRRLEIAGNRQVQD